MSSASAGGRQINVLGGGLRFTGVSSSSKVRGNSSSLLELLEFGAVDGGTASLDVSNSRKTSLSGFWPSSPEDSTRAD